MIMDVFQFQDDYQYELSITQYNDCVIKSSAGKTIAIPLEFFKFGKYDDNVLIARVLSRKAFACAASFVKMKVFW